LFLGDQRNRMWDKKAGNGWVTMVLSKDLVNLADEKDCCPVCSVVCFILQPG
jgi:hypothetical protein